MVYFKTMAKFSKSMVFFKTLGDMDQVNGPIVLCGNNTIVYGCTYMCFHGKMKLTEMLSEKHV